MNKYICIIALLLSGCEATVPAPPRDYWMINQVQKCEMCGSTYIVNSKVKEPATSEWCFDDGVPCWEGLRILAQFDMNKTPKDAYAQSKWIEHCKDCVGCKCSTFSPEEWHDITKPIEVH
jgi:hypothetical protein